MFPGYWGLGTNANYNPVISFQSLNAETGYQWVTNRDRANLQSVDLIVGPAYLNRFINASNFVGSTTTSNTIGNSTNYITVTTNESSIGVAYQIVYFPIALNSLDSPDISHNVYFSTNAATIGNWVEWVWTSTNFITGLPQANHLCTCAMP